jgi:hypothetical protein
VRLVRQKVHQLRAVEGPFGEPPKGKERPGRRGRLDEPAQEPVHPGSAEPGAQGRP